MDIKQLLKLKIEVLLDDLPVYTFKVRDTNNVYYKIVVNEDAHLVGKFGSHHGMLINIDNPKYFIDHPFLEKEFK